MRAARLRALRALGAVALACASSEAVAAGKAPADKDPAGSEDSYVLYKLAPENSIFSFDYGPPKSAALNLLGLSADQTTTSSSLKKFVLSAPAVFGKEENKSVAFDFAPLALLEPKSHQTFNRYSTPGQGLYRLAYRTRVNLAAKNGAANSDASKAVNSGMALGLTASLLDSGDPLASGRDPQGRPYIQHCFARYTPIVMSILESTRDFSSAQAEAMRAVRDLQRASAAVRAGNLGEARRRADAYLPGAAPAAAEGPVATAPREIHEPAASTKARALAANPLLKEKLGPDLGAQLADVLNELANAAASTPPKTPEAATTAVGPGEPSTISDSDLGKLIDDRLDVWQAKLDKLNAENAAAIVTKADARIKADLHYSGAAEAFAACASQADLLAHYGADINVGVGQLWNGRAGQLAHLQPKGQVIWGAFRYPIGLPAFDFDAKGADGAPKPITLPTNALMLVGSGRFGLHERVATGDKATPQIVANTINAWLGLQYLHPGMRATAQYGWVKTDPKLASQDVFRRSGDRYLVSTQWRLGDESSGFWLGVSYGNGYGDAAALKANTALVTFSYSPPKPPDLTTAN